MVSISLSKMGKRKLGLKGHTFQKTKKRESVFSMHIIKFLFSNRSRVYHENILTNLVCVYYPPKPYM